MGVLDGKVALITGGTSGVGLSAAAIFAEAGAKVVVIGRDRERGEAALAELRAKPIANASFLFGQADISVEADVARVVALTISEFGRVDVAFLNSGVSGSGQMIESMSEEVFDRAIANNLKGPFLCLKHLIPVLTAPGGSVIFTSSIASLTGSPGRAEYTAAKGGLNAFTRAAAMELAPRGIRVNVISPAGILTPMAHNFLERMGGGPEGKAAALAAANAGHPLGRMAEPEEVAATALFLASDAAAMITGQNISVDGGMSAGRTQGF